jgi:hypothetical protein
MIAMANLGCRAGLLDFAVLGIAVNIASWESVWRADLKGRW